MHRAAFSCRESCVGVFSPLSLQKFAHVINLPLFWCTGRSLPTWGKFNLITWLYYGVLPSVIYCFWPAAEQRSTSKSKGLFGPFCYLPSQVPGSDSTPIFFWPYMNRRVSGFLTLLNLGIYVKKKKKRWNESIHFRQFFSWSIQPTGSIGIWP